MGKKEGFISFPDLHFPQKMAEKERVVHDLVPSYSFQAKRPSGHYFVLTGSRSGLLHNLTLARF